MFKFIKKIFVLYIILVIFIIGSTMLINYKNHKNLTEKLTIASTKKDKPKDSTTKNDNITISMEDIKNNSQVASISQVMSDIVSNENNYDLLVKYNETNTLVVFDKDTKNVSMVALEDNNTNDFDILSTKTDKYINFDTNTCFTKDDLNNLKSDFLSSDISGKFNIINKVINNSDTNMTESDLLDLYFTYIYVK